MTGEEQCAAPKLSHWRTYPDAYGHKPGHDDEATRPAKMRTAGVRVIAAAE
jgi:hypothetical protein